MPAIRRRTRESSSARSSCLANRASGEQSDLLDSFRKLCETTLDHEGLARPLADCREELAREAHEHGLIPKAFFMNA